MKIEILRNTVADGKAVKTGDIAEVSDSNAKTLILLGKAKIVADAAKKEEKKEPKKETPPIKQPADKKESIEDALEKDADLGDTSEDETPDLNKLSYESLVEMASDYGVAKPNGMKKAKLIEEIKAAQAKKAA